MNADPVAQPVVDGRAELRIALATSGAIALVLYESGAAHEICNFVNGAGPYASAFTDANLRPVVDVLTGASAGGINSVFLANCFVNGADFSDFTDIWIQTAAIDQLQYPAGQTPTSVLDIDGLKAKMGAILQSHVGTSKAGFRPQYAEDDDLAVRLCRTDLRGYCVNTIDAAGHRIDTTSRADVVAYNCAVFRDKNMVDDVVAAAAATSAFPIAFAPVFSNGRWYVDGGLWNNQPIDLAVEAIRDKPAYNRTHRCIFFIDPDPSVIPPTDDPSLPAAERLKAFQDSAKAQANTPPSVLEGIAFIPGMGVKGDILPSLQSILNFNRRAELYQQAIAAPTLAENLAGIAGDFMRENPAAANAYDRLSLLTKVRFESVIFDDDPKLISTWAAIRERRPDFIDPATAAMQAALLSIKDADMQRRAVRRALTEMNAQLHVPSTSLVQAVANPQKRDLYALLKQLNAVLEANSTVLDESPTVAYAEHVRTRVSRFRSATETIMARMTKAMQSGAQLNAGSFDEWTQNVNAVELVPWPRHSGNAAAEPTGLTVTDLDVVRYVLAGVSDLDEKGQLDLVRVSPNDTNNTYLIGKTVGPDETGAAVKLAGRGLGHMQGFFEERWRRNDYTWGRLDVAEILCRALQTYAKREAVAGGGNPSTFDDAWHDRLLRAVQTVILQQEAERFAPRANKGTNTAKNFDPSQCGVPSRNPTSEADRQKIRMNSALIGYGGETLADAVEPQFSKNVEYIAATLPKMFRGSSAKPPELLDRMARFSRILSYVTMGISWIFPLQPLTFRAKMIRGLFVIAILGATFAWGLRTGQGGHFGQEALTLGLALVGAFALVALGAGLGYRFRFALYGMLALGVIGGYVINEKFSDRLVGPYPLDFAIAVGAGAIMVLTIPFAFDSGGRPKKAKPRIKAG